MSAGDRAHDRLVEGKDADRSAAEVEMLRAQRESWSSAAAGWDESFDAFESFAAPVGVELAQLAGVAPGHAVLDVGCGNGGPSLTIARLVGAEGRVLGVDLAEPMIESARRRAEREGVTNAKFLARDAQTLDGLGPFDAAVSRFALMLVPDPARAARAIRSTLAPGSRFAACVWGEATEVPFCAVVPLALERALGIAPPVGDVPGPVRLGRADALAGVLRAGGFEEVEESVRRVEPRFASVAEAVRFFVHASGGARKALDARGPEDRTRFEDELTRQLATRRAEDGSVVLPSAVRIASGVAR